VRRARDSADPTATAVVNPRDGTTQKCPLHERSELSPARSKVALGCALSRTGRAPCFRTATSICPEPITVSDCARNSGLRRRCRSPSEHFSARDQSVRTLTLYEQRPDSGDRVGNRSEQRLLEISADLSLRDSLARGWQALAGLSGARPIVRCARDCQDESASRRSVATSAAASPPSTARDIHSRLSPARAATPPSIGNVGTKTITASRNRSTTSLRSTGRTASTTARSPDSPAAPTARGDRPELRLSIDDQHPRGGGADRRRRRASASGFALESSRAQGYPGGARWS
jgi:hypothetical protein